MCDYTKVEYRCGHLRFTVRAWCHKYQISHKRCPLKIAAIEYRFEEQCGDCRPSAPRYGCSKSSSSSSSTKSTSTTSSSRK